MLVLSRQVDESIMVGDDIELKVVDIRGDKVRLGITAPKDVAVHRREVWQQIKRDARDRVNGVVDKVIDTIAAVVRPKAADATLRTFPPVRDQAHGLRAQAIGDEARRRAEENATQASGCADVDEAADENGQAPADQREEASPFARAAGVPADRPSPLGRSLRSEVAGRVHGLDG